MLWVWQRPQDVRFLDPQKVGVSLLVQTVWLSEAGVGVEPNLNRSLFPQGTWLMACTRIQVEHNVVPQMTAEQADEVAERLASTAQIPGVRAIQVDFDATASQRAFYHEVLQRLRLRLPKGYPVSITALASWCATGDWLRNLPVQEAVPMLFRMGLGRSLARFAEAGGIFREPICRGSAGIATDEPTSVSGNRHVYVFDPKGWTEADYRAIIGQIITP